MKRIQPGTAAQLVTDGEFEGRDRPPQSLVRRQGFDFGAVDLLTAVGPDLGASVATLGASAAILVEKLDPLDAQQIGRVAAQIHCRALWLQAHVENLLCVAIIREGRFRLRTGRIELVEVAAEVRAVMEPLLVEKAQRVRLSPRGTIRDVVGDRQRIAQVLVNLLSNAIRFAHPGTPIDVAIASRDDRVRVSVSDRGPGLPTAGAESLFTPSCRTTEATRPGAVGLGLGLAIVKHIVEAHDGRVGAGPRPGGGARVWFDLPVAAPQPSADR